MTSSKKIIGNYYYYMSDRLGDGMSSEVYRGFNKNDGQAVAIKILSKEESQRTKNSKLVEAELKFLQRLKGKPNIIQLHSTIKTKHNVYIITDLCENGTLADLLKYKKKFSQAKAQDYLSQIIKGYQSLVSEGIVHRDIKPENLLINQNHEIMIADFGLSIEKDCEESQAQKLAGSPYYMAPQIINSSEKIQYSSKSDIWAIGITFLEMLLGHLPWKSKTQQDFVRELLEFDIENSIPDTIGNKSKTFLRRSLTSDPHSRMNCQELIKFSGAYFISQDQNQEIIQSLTKSQPYSDQSEKISKVNKEKLQRVSSLHQQQPIQVKKIRPMNEGQSQYSTSNNSVESKLKTKSQGRKTSANQDENQKKALSSPRKKYGFKQMTNFILQEIQEEPFHDNIKSIPDKEAILQLKAEKKSKRTRKQSFQVPSFNSANVLQEKKIRQRKQSADVSSNNDYLLFAKNLEKKARKQSVQDPSLEDILLSFDDPERQAKKVVTPSQSKKEKHAIEQQILKQIQCHINYFRLLFRIYKKIKDFLKTNDKGIISFKKQLLELFENALDNSKQLKQIYGISSQQKEQFKRSSHYSQLLLLLEGYQKRYDREHSSQDISVQLKGEKSFKKLLMYVLKILAQNVVLIESNEEEMNRKKDLIFIIEDIIILNKLWLDQNIQQGQKIKQKYRISEYLQKNPPEQIRASYWKGIKNELIQYIQS